MLLDALFLNLSNALMIGGCKLSKHGAYYMQDPSLSISVVGALQYATLTRPEISFAVT